MRLLKKEELATAKSLDRQREVQEGIKLAKRVDSLRETQAEEEASLQRFRETPLANIHEETTKAGAERDHLLIEVRKLQQERENALIPLTEEWRVLEDAQRQFLREKSQLDESQQELDRLSVETEQNLQVILDKVNQTNSILNQARKFAEDREAEKALADKALVDAQKILSDAEEKSHKAYEEIKDREMEVTKWEELVFEREVAVNEKEADLVTREIALRDKYETFMRSKNRK